MSQDSPTFSIVYLNYNKIAETRRTTEQLLALTRNLDRIEIIAVDNHSSDGTKEYLEEQSPRIKVLPLKDNYGIAGYNEAFKIAQGKYILVLDDDSAPCDNNIFRNFTRIFESSPKIGAIACHIIDETSQDQWSWHLPANKESGISTAFVGCGFAIRRELFKSIGWYPKSFFIYENEAKVAFEIRKAGYEIYYDKTCLIQHRGNLAQRPGWRRVFYPTRNNLWLIRQYYPPPTALYLIFSRLIISLLNSIRLGIPNAYFKGAKEGLFTPITKTPLNTNLQNKFKAYYHQNSIIHQFFKQL